MRRPLVVGVSELRRRPGTRREVHVAAALPGLATSAARVPPGGEVAFDGVIEAIEGGVSITGAVTAPWSGECRRCLEHVEGSLDTGVREIFEAHPTEGETYPIEGTEIDLEPVLHDAVLLALPLAPICRPDCAGPAPDAFPTGSAAEAGSGPGSDRGGEPEPDPRWAALRELRFEDD